MGRGLVAAGAALILAGGGVLGYGLTRKPQGGASAELEEAMRTAATALDGELKGARDLAGQRAETLAEIVQIKAVVSTDAATARDMAGREITLKPQDGEVIELGQIPKQGPPVSLLVLPDGGMRASRSGTIGAFAELVGDQLLVTRTVAVTPSDTTAELSSGFVTVSRPFSARPVIDRLTTAGLSGRLEVGDQKLAFGPDADKATEVIAMPASEASAQFVFAAGKVTGGVPVAVVGAGAGVAGLGLILLLIGLMSRKDQGGNTQLGLQVHPSAAAQPGFAATQLSTTPTPPPTGGDGAGSLATGDIGPGAVIGRWEVVRRLGSGGMAEVYLAHARGEAGFEKLVALKVMHSHLARNERAVAHFLDEARLAARVTHANVVQIQDLGKIGNDYVIVMEYVDGVDLEHLLMAARDAERQVPLDVGLGILSRISDGLHAAHTAISPDGTPLGIIHRDVKSANVLVSKQGGVKVVDFGIAKATNQVHLTVAGETKGTPSMMAPEQRVGDQVDVRVDVYALAAVAFEVLTGRAVNLDLAALAHLGIEGWPHLPAPSSLRAELPPELDQILLTAMAYERERRPASCEAFEAMLEAVMKRYNLNASDKDIARWVDGELRAMGVVPSAGQSLSRPG